MHIEGRIRRARGLTPAEQQLAQTVLAMGGRMESATIRDLADAASVSVATVHRFCKKIGLEGFKELKVELARAGAARAGTEPPVDINFPFGPGDGAGRVVPRMRSLYEETLADTCELLDPAELERAAGMLLRARRIGIYTQSHNLHPAQMFCDRLLSVGRDAFCHGDVERQYRSALAAGPDDAAVVISYSGLSPYVAGRLEVLAGRGVPVVFIGTPSARRLNPGLDCYLLLSDLEHFQDRITQFASHIALQFVLDALFGCVFARDFEGSSDFLRRLLPYSRRLIRGGDGTITVKSPL